MLEAEIGIHLLQTPILLLHILETSDVRHPLRPANLFDWRPHSTSFRIFTICVSVKRLLRMLVLLYIAGVQENSSRLSD